MNIDKIKYLITNPQSINTEDIETIKNLKNKYPYCSSLHMLFVKGLANSNHIDFEDELKKSAIQVNDRARLHELIHQTKKDDNPTPILEKTIENVEVVEPNIKPFTPIKEEVDIKKKADTKPITPEIKTVKPDMAKIIEDIRLKAEAARKKHSKTTTELKPVEVQKTTETPIKASKIIENDPLTEDIIEETKVDLINDSKKNTETKDEATITPSTIHNDTNVKEVSDDPIEDIKINKTEENAPAESKPLNINVMAHAMEVAFELDVDNIIRSDTQETKKDIVEVATVRNVDINNLSFTDWLKYKQGLLKVDKVKKEETVDSEKIKLSKQEIDHLLDKFIEEEPKITRLQKEFYNPAKNAKKSLDDTTFLVSETLAKIYWMQKNYDKAIRAYEQLSLRNPEKKSFFANQIKKIKQEVK